MTKVLLHTAMDLMRTEEEEEGGEEEGKGREVNHHGGKFEINEITKKVNHHGKIITVGAKREKDQPRDAKSKQLIQVN